MSKIYVVIETFYDNYNVVNAWASEEEAIKFCNSTYKRNRGKVPSWTTEHKWFVIIDEIEFNGLVNDKALS
jgi:hypothetical protein